MGDHQTARDLARAYRGRGWKPLRIDPREKGPRTKGWQEVEFPDEMFAGPVEWNVGVQLGAASGGLVDIDFDWLKAARIGDMTFGFAPSFGRRSNPDSHRLVRVSDRDPRGKVPTKKYHVAGRTKEQKGMVLEVRGCGMQTVFPGSVHPSGERIEWAGACLPDISTMMTLEELRRLADATVVLTIAAAYWPAEGNRDTFSMAVAGVLLRMQFAPELVDDWVVHAAELAGDEEAQKRRKAAATKVKLDAGEETTGLPTMLELLATDEAGVKALLKKSAGFKASPAAAQDKRKAAVPPDAICISPGMLNQALEQVQDVLLARGVPLFQRGGQLVMPVRQVGAGSADDDVQRAAGSLLLHRPNGAGLLSIIVRDCVFWSTNSKGIPVAKDPDVKLANILGQARERWRFRALDGITGVPVFRPDGSILTAPGYDPVTRLYFDAAGMVFPDVKDVPTRADAQAALEELKRPFRGFPIPKRECKSALLAGLITVVIVPTVDAVPAIGVSAPSPAFGKTKVQRCIGAMAMGTDPASMNQSTSDEEDAKRLDAVLLAGDPIIAIDNVTRPVGGDVLCSIVTNPVHKVRVLGRSEVPQVSARVQVIVNGNHLAFWGDMCRRALLVVIEDENVEKPEEREFDFCPVEETLAARGAMVAAALTILRAWHCAGRPRPEGYKPMGSFEGWECVRLALLWLGEADPRGSQALVVEDDPQREADADLLDLLHHNTAGDVFRAADLRGRTHDEKGRPTPLGDALLDGGPWNSKRAGNRLRLLVGRWIGNVRLRKVKDDVSRGNQLRIERRDGKPAGAF